MKEGRNEKITLGCYNMHFPYSSKRDEFMVKSKGQQWLWKLCTGNKKTMTRLS